MAHENNNHHECFNQLVLPAHSTSDFAANGCGSAWKTGKRWDVWEMTTRRVAIAITKRTEFEASERECEEWSDEMVGHDQGFYGLGF